MRKSICCQEKAREIDFLGWIDLPVDYDKEEFARIKKLQKRLRVIPMYWLSLVLEGPT